MRSEYGNLWETHQCRPHAYGHTWSPGYELPSGMLHGHAVATGMGLGAYLSFCEGWTMEHDLERILKLLSGLELSLWHPIMEDTHRIYNAQTRAVKKRGGNLVAPVPKGIGKCGYINHLPYELLVKRLHEYHRICEGYPRGGLGVEAHCRDVGLKDPSTEGIVNKDVLEIPIGYVNSYHGDENQGKLEVHVNNGPLEISQGREDEQKKISKNLPAQVAFERADDTKSPPRFEPNELCYPGKVIECLQKKIFEVN